MNRVFYCFVLLNAAICFVAAVAAYWRNRSTIVGPLFAAAMFSFGLWFIGFAQYYQPLRPTMALHWASFTLAAGIINASLFLHGLCALANQHRRLRWWIACSYALSAVLLVLLYRGDLVVDLKTAPYMDHYLRYNRTWYPLLGLHIAGWQWFGAITMLVSARKATGYKRTQLIYLLATWFIAFLAGNSVILPLEYDVYILPFGFLVLPLSLILLTYAISTARWADFNEVITRLLVHTVMLMLVVLLSLLFIGGITLATPNFMNQSQILFTVFVAITIAMVLTTILPRFLPQAERLVQHRLGGDRLGYQDVLAGLMKELSAESDIDALLQRVATSLHSQMQLSRVLIFLQDPLMDEYRLLAQDEISRQKCDELTPLAANGPVVRWLAENKDSLVRDEQLRVMPREAWKKLADCLDPLQVAVCIPLLIEENLTGVLCLGEKVNKDMFFVSDLKLLVTLATEVALGIRYRRMEEQIVRNNKLISLGTVAAGVAHEIRNPLSSIRAFAQLLPTRSDDPEFKNDFSKRVLQDVDRITTVIQSMLSFAHPGVVTIDNYDAADLIDGALTLIQPRLRGRHIEVTKHFHNPLTLRVDKQQIIQVLLNLLTNALDALPERGRIRITTGVRSVESHQQQPEQHLGIIEIADNGHGISAAIRKRLFDPFFTTKPEGTGLGLSISQKIAQDHGGFISVSSVEGTGATFQLHLPLSQIGISA